MRLGSITLERKHLKRAWDYVKTANWLNVLANRRAQSRFPDIKIFIIGPNRCATTSFHRFFHRNGLRALHCRIGSMYLAKEIRDRLGDDKSLKAFLSRWTVYSDFVYLTDNEHFEAHDLYETYARLFPQAYFILNDRDVDRWVGSRLNFKDDFLPRYLSVHGGTAQKAEAKWRNEFAQHREAALTFFAGHPRFIHVPIDRNVQSGSAIDPVIEMMRPHFKLDSRLWQPLNASTQGKG
ncbi:sulfotransferase [Sphingorhabdus sp. 109]|jgi:hypothetical protein|uniref:sulfotransferase n=1 Tax=Sphingorhabdus sp. 109 TaxID=2653173 RepID=UPI0012F1353B|nr:sulfotransferase [Sphingorhabdus sp. 109]VWX60807.1 conserved hypothetical protein [Sphingorhabdus sp. 109]